MTRFDADTPAERQELFAEAIQARRQRGGPFVTIEVDPGDVEGADADPAGEFSDTGNGTGGGDVDAGSDENEDDEELPPWIQYADGEVNLDCTDEELDRLKGVLANYPSFRIDEMTSPEEAEGTNVRVSARADAGRVAQFLDDALREVYELPEDYRAWVVEI